MAKPKPSNVFGYYNDKVKFNCEVKEEVMAIDCKFVPYLTTKQIVFPFPATEKVTKFKLSPACFPFLISSSSSSLPLRPTVISAYKKNVVESNYYEDTFTLTYLEGNSWLWEVGGIKILVDPILVGNLDFGIPWLYDAAKKFVKNFQLDDLPLIHCLLITQSLDDHCHLNTLKPLSRKFPSLTVIATPNAKTLLDPIFTNVIYLEPGQDSAIEVSNGFQVKIKATAGPVLGPPWQRPENGYLVTSPKGALTLYYEPHCVYNKTTLEKHRADIVITPVIKQLLPNFTLVSGQEDAVQLAKCLSAKFVVPMKNGDLDSKGLLASIVKSEGTMESFKQLLSKELPDAKVVEPTPGEPLDISIPVHGQ